MSGDTFINIDRIVLHGLEHVDGKTLAAALKQSLVAQLTSSPVRNPAAATRVQTQIALPEAVSAEQMGRALAQNLHRVISSSAVTPEQDRAGKRGGQPDA